MQDLFIAFLQDPTNAGINLPKLGWPLNDPTNDDVLLFGAGGNVTSIEHGALYQSLCADVEAYEGSLDGTVDSGQA
jgi:hypothetical protein